MFRLSKRVTRRWATVLCAALFAFFVAACTSDGSSEEPAADADVQTSTVSITIDCEENLLFSRYDLEVEVDDSSQGILDHGASKTFEMELPDGDHMLQLSKEDDSSVDGNVDFTVTGETSLHYKAHCTSSQVEIEVVDLDEQESDEQIPEDEIAEEPDSERGADATDETTVDEPIAVSHEDLNALLNAGDMADLSWFSSKYEGSTITFDGWVTYMVNHENYDTRWDVLILAGNSDGGSALSPYFRLTDVSIYDMNVTNSDSLREGDNITITATVGEYDSAGGYLELDPVSISVR